MLIRAPLKTPVGLQLPAAYPGAREYGPGSRALLLLPAFAAVATTFVTSAASIYGDRLAIRGAIRTFVAMDVTTDILPPPPPYPCWRRSPS